MKYLLPLVYQSNEYPHRSGYKCTKITPIKNGYRINRFSNYISLQSIKLIYNDNGFSKATVIVNTNYVPQYTLYFDDKGNEVKADNVKAERKLWLALQAA